MVPTALSAPEARDNAPALQGGDIPLDWDDPVPDTGAHVFSALAYSCEAGEIQTAKTFFAPRAQLLPGATREFALALVSGKGGSCFRIGDERGGYRFRFVDSTPHFG